MKDQFLREHHARQDKAKKPDYRGEMIERGRSPPSAQYPGALAAAKRLADAPIKYQVIKNLRKAGLFLGKHHFVPGWSLEQFATDNGLVASEPATKAAYDAIRHAAFHDMDRLTTAIMRGTVRTTRQRGGGMTFHVSYTISGLKCQISRPPPTT